MDWQSLKVLTFLFHQLDSSNRIVLFVGLPGLLKLLEPLKHQTSRLMSQAFKRTFNVIGQSLLAVRIQKVQPFTARSFQWCLLNLSALASFSGLRFGILAETRL